MNRVLQVNVEVGGVLSLVQSVAVQISNQIPFDFYVISSESEKSAYDKLTDQGLQVFEMKKKGNKVLKQILLPFDFHFFLKKHDYDTIHIHSDSAWKMMLYLLPAKLCKTKKVIVHSHSSDVNGKFSTLKKCMHHMCRWLLPYFATDFCTCSGEATKWMYPVKIHDKVRMIHNGVDTKKFEFDPDTRTRVRNKTGIKDGEVLIGTVGNMSYQKNPEFAVSVCKELKKKNFNFKFVFVGDDSNSDSLKQLVREKGLTDKILFYGKTNAVYEILNAMDIFLLPSRFEGLPVCGIESQSNGLPIIYSDKVTKELDYTDRSFYLPVSENSEIKWAEKIMDISKNKFDRKKGYEETINNHFDIRNTAKEFVELYNN